MKLTSEITYVAGILQRSGTNWLYDLLAKHPAHKKGTDGEDFFIHHSNYIHSYANKLRKHWNNDWNAYQKNWEKDILSEFGKGLVRVLRQNENIESGSKSDCTKRPKKILTKTPSPKNVSNFFSLFPRGKLIILVRDGRSVVESGMRSYDWSFRRGVYRWREGARTILDLEETKNSQRSYCIVRYEDLFKDTVGELKKIFDFLKLDWGIYDFESALDSPVKGSSTYGQDETNNSPGVNWEPVEKKESFDPLRRWKSWPAIYHYRFNRIAGQELKKFDYTLVEENYVRGKEKYIFWKIYDPIAHRTHNIAQTLKEHLN